MPPDKPARPTDTPPPIVGAPADGHPATPGTIRDARQAMEPRGPVDLPRTTVGPGDGGPPHHSAAYDIAIDQTLRKHYQQWRMGDFDKLPDDKKNEARANAMKQMPDDLTAQSGSGFVHEFQKDLLHAHFDVMQNPRAPVKDRMESATALADLNPRDKEVLAGQKQKWDSMSPAQQKAAVDEAMSTPPGERAKAAAQAKKEGRYSGLLDVSDDTLKHFAMAADPAKERAITTSQFSAREGLRSDARAQTIDQLQTQLVDNLSPKATDARGISQAVVDKIKDQLYPTARDRTPEPGAYSKIASDLEQQASHEPDGQKAATMRAAAKLVSGAGRDLGTQERASDDAIRQAGDGGDLRRAGLGATDQRGERAQTAAEMQRGMETRLAERNRSGDLANDAKDPERLRRELGIRDEDLRRLQPAERAKLAEELRGRLAGYGMAADILPGLVRDVFRLGH